MLGMNRQAVILTQLRNTLAHTAILRNLLAFALLLCLATSTCGLGANLDPRDLPSVQTSFSLTEDIFPIKNPDAECEGIVYFTLWYYENRANEEGNLRRRFGELEAESLAEEAQQIMKANPPCIFPDENQIVAGIIRDLASGPVPVRVQTLTYAHSLLAYEWNTDTNEIYCYDPNCLGTTATIRCERTSIGGIDWYAEACTGKEDIYGMICPADKPKDAEMALLHEKWSNIVSVTMGDIEVDGGAPADWGDELTIKMSASKSGLDIRVSIAAFIARETSEGMVQVFETLGRESEFLVDPWTSDSWQDQFAYTIPATLPAGRYYVSAVVQDGAKWSQYPFGNKTMKVYATSGDSESRWEYAFELGPEIVGHWEASANLFINEEWACSSQIGDAWSGFQTVQVTLDIQDSSDGLTGSLALDAGDGMPWIWQVSPEFADQILTLSGQFDWDATLDSYDEVKLPAFADLGSPCTGLFTYDPVADSLSGALELSFMFGMKMDDCDFGTRSDELSGNVTFKRIQPEESTGSSDEQLPLE